MTALVVSPALAPSFLVGLAVTLAAAVLVAHWGAYRPQAKRMIAASLIASIVVVSTAPVVRAEDVVLPNLCKNFEPWSWEWIVLGCMLPRRRRRLQIARRPR